MITSKNQSTSLFAAPTFQNTITNGNNKGSKIQMTSILLLFSYCCLIFTTSIFPKTLYYGGIWIFPLGTLFWKERTATKDVDCPRGVFDNSR